MKFPELQCSNKKTSIGEGDGGGGYFMEQHKNV